MPEVVLVLRQCRSCTAIFYVCRHCYRGQRYCGDACRKQARLEQRRAANKRYQQSEAGHRTHRMRQRNYRLRHSGARVTDHSTKSAIPSPSPKLLGSDLTLCRLWLS